MHEKKLPYEDEEISIGDSIISKKCDNRSIEALGDTLNFIETWLKLLDKNYDVRSKAYITAMKEMSKQIHTTTTKPFSMYKKFQKLVTEIGGGW